MNRSAPDPQLVMLRAQIDELDERIVDLLAERTAVVRRVARVKHETGSDEDGYRSLDRVEAVVGKIRELAAERGMDPRIAERTYRALIAALTEMQLGLLDEHG